MFIIRHKPTGLYFKSFSWCGHHEPVLVDKSKARVYRTRGAAKTSVGNWIYLREEERKGRDFGYYHLNESLWEIVEVSLEIK